MVRFVVAVSILVYVFSVPIDSYAKEYVTMFDNSGNIARIDLSTTLMALTEAPLEIDGKINKLAGLDPSNNNMFIANCENDTKCTLKVYSISDFSYKNALGIDLVNNDITIKEIPAISKLLIQYYLPAEGDIPDGYTTDIYDAKYLVEIGNAQDYFSLENVMLSRDGKKIYSIVGGREAHANVIDVNNFSITSCIDIRQIQRSDITFVSIADAKAGTLLFDEDLKLNRQDDDIVDFSIYDLDLSNYITRGHIGLQGDLLLSPDGKIIFFDENKTIRKIKGGETIIKGIQPLGRISIYDAATSKKIGTITFEVAGQGKILGFDTSLRNIFYSYKPKNGTSRVLMIDTKTLSVYKTFDIPFEILHFVDYTN